MKAMQPHRSVRPFGLVVLLLLTACGRPDTGSVSGAQLEPRATVVATAVPTPAPTEPASATATSVPEEAPQNEEQATAVPTPNAPMLQRARERGTLRVVVTLAIPWKPEGELPDEAAALNQRRAIADAQQALTARLAPYNVTEITTFEFIPSMAMVVDAAALGALMSDPGVESVQEDTPASPSLDGPAAPSLDAPN